MEERACHKFCQLSAKVHVNDVLSMRPSSHATKIVRLVDFGSGARCTCIGFSSCTSPANIAAVRASTCAAHTQHSTQSFCNYLFDRAIDREQVVIALSQWLRPGVGLLCRCLWLQDCFPRRGQGLQCGTINSAKQVGASTCMPGPVVQMALVALCSTSSMFL